MKMVAIKKNDEVEAIYPTPELNGLTFLNIVDRIESVVVQKSTEPIKQGSLNNCRGTWYELAFIKEAHRSILKATENLYLVKMGSETSIKFWEIYQKQSRQKYDVLVDMFRKREEQIFIRCSTPDFVVISRDLIRDSSSSNILQNPSPPLKEINELLPSHCKNRVCLQAVSRQPSAFCVERQLFGGANLWS